ncbi:uncharacterized protein BO72DRAFT_477559 [Aspergillus fijiensis CBS 313.89]|uniref:DUF7357 domain-containing protein n=1 Tax=Aspergillus fijiensis CBS 313.89 TaxID=1448319 RepID=A0A8G1RPV7_9EURO|nr:uncharacterized protein BO72DRAFT_477559 [Aspergillus fijiensis CBS 313.89]RAK77124.1 hypothetical protein BO72DRAFT_477559 [Aspergillus fijiensis CBS 313.89]
MRLHLTIQRHGLPVTRILWTTSPHSLFGPNASNGSPMIPAAASAITSTRLPNALYSNGGYTFAQLLEDVNEVIPLETESVQFDEECSGQWGLEDYVVEVGGSECLHFMEVDGLLRDGDEVLIRALQIEDLRARRLSGRHQISGDGKHLIDGVPFGKPFLKRPTSSRPAITIPPRKKRRTTIAGWDYGVRYDDDADWEPPKRLLSNVEVDALRNSGNSEGEKAEGHGTTFQDDFQDYHEPEDDDDDGTIIRHPVDQESESDSDMSDTREGELEEELKALAEDSEAPPITKPEDQVKQQTESAPRALRPGPRTPSTTPKRDAPKVIQSTSTPADSRTDAKVVQFENEKPALKPESILVSKAKSPSVSSAGSVADDSDSSSLSTDSSGVSDSSSDQDSSSESGHSLSGSDDSDDSNESDDSDDSDDESTSESDDSSASESEDENISDSDTSVEAPIKNAPPGAGSLRTKKSNQRNKMRRRLAKLKELGALPAQADFAALREWENVHGCEYYIPETKPEPKSETKSGAKAEVNSKTRGDKKEQERAEFEARRQKLLQDLAAGGVDVSVTPETENVPPHDENKRKRRSARDVSVNGNTDSDSSKRRTLDVASSRRMLFGSLGVRAPRNKEDEDATRRKLAANITHIPSRKSVSQDAETGHESDLEHNWEERLTIRATECIYNDIELTAPPFPFEQRWDHDASNIIRQRKGRGKKRKRRQQLQVYDAGEEEYGNWEDSYFDGDDQLNYDDTEQLNGEHQAEYEAEEPAEDLPVLPANHLTLPDLSEDHLQRASVIAFKQLDLSKATNWQPTVSEYRVAEIHDVYEDNILKIRLAKRDRRQIADVDPDEVGNDKPYYTGFEMPGLEDDAAEDDGFRELSFADFIEPKLLRAAPAAGTGDAEKPSISHAAEESTTPKITTPARIEATAARDGDEDGQRPAPAAGDKPADSGPNKPILQETVNSSKSLAGDSSPVLSPQFHGFQSPPPTGCAKKASGSASNLIADAEPIPDGGADRQPDVLLPPDKNSPNTLDSPQRPDGVNLGRAADASNDDLQMISSPLSVLSFNQLMNRYFPAKRERSDTPPSNQQAQGEEARPSSRSSTSSMVPNPFFEIGRAREEGQQELSSQPSEGIGVTAGDTTLDLQSLVGSSSTPPSGQRSVQKNSKWKDTEDSSLISVVPESMIPPVVPQPNSPGTPGSESIVVDLTQSSPPVSPGGSDRDFGRSQRLPQGPGWVQKHVPPTQRRTRQSLARLRGKSREGLGLESNPSR